MSDDQETLLEFPSAFPIKAFGRDAPAFRETVVEIVARHAQFDPEADVRVNASSKGNFVSITVTFTAESKAQVDTIYQTLHDHDLVLMVI
jgi:putative lipoic acid-binding regulatory protein